MTQEDTHGAVQGKPHQSNRLVPIVIRVQGWRTRLDQNIEANRHSNDRYSTAGVDNRQVGPRLIPRKMDQGMASLCFSNGVLMVSITQTPFAILGTAVEIP